MSTNENKSTKKEYVFGSIKTYDLEKIEQEVLKESVYLDVFAGSDIAFKENCEKFDSSIMLEKLTKLQGYSFKYKINEFPANNFPDGEQFGLMAQEIEQLFPNLVKKDELGNRYVNYTQLIPVMVETIKDLADRISALENKLN